MEDSKINAVIATFLGWYRLFRHDRGDSYVWNNPEGFETKPGFTKSLDSLFPAVRKLHESYGESVSNSILKELSVNMKMELVNNDHDGIRKVAENIAEKIMELENG
jgi:hypothetical protein